MNQNPSRRGARTRLAYILSLALLLTACGDTSRDDQAGRGGGGQVRAGDTIPESRGYERREPELAHIHGIGENPKDGSIYLATHFGLWRMQPGKAPQRVGKHLHDLMGFSVVGPDHFIASGHPNGARSLPPHLGLVESTDAGRTWRSRSLLGSADFHALRAVDGATVGWNSTTGNLMVSEDLEQWDVRAERLALVDFAIDPATRETVVISSPRSQTSVELRRSRDGGRSFTTVKEAPQLARFAWSHAGRLWGFALDGAVWRSSDGGRAWRRTGTVGALPEAVSDTGHELLAAAGGSILRSSDDGRTWDELHDYAG